MWWGMFGRGQLTGSLLTVTATILSIANWVSLRIFRVLIIEEAPMRQEPAYEEPGDSN